MIKVSKPLVSVIIPAFNSEAYLLAAIESVFQQTYSPIEIIVIDDGSTDRTRDLLEDLIASNRINYHHQSNRGLSAARNVGIRFAKGKYIQFLDADDVILPSKIEKQVKVLESSAVSSIVGTDFRFFDKSDLSNLYGGDRLKGLFPLREVERLFEFETVIHRWLFPAELFDSYSVFDENMPGAAEDWLVLWKLAARGTRFIYLDEPLALYRRHNDNITRNFEILADAHFLAISHVEKYQEQNKIALYSKKDLDALRETFHYGVGLHLLRRNRVLRAWKHLLRALFLSSNRRQVKLLLVASVPPLGAGAIGWVTSMDNRLWRWRAQLRKAFVGS